MIIIYNDYYYHLSHKCFKLLNFKHPVGNSKISLLSNAFINYCDNNSNNYYNNNENSTYQCVKIYQN